MRMGPLSFLKHVLDSIVPPRHSEKTLTTLTLSQLQDIQGQRESLPYRDERVRALVWELKYYSNRHAAVLGAGILRETLLHIAAESVGTPLLIPIPMHDARRRERGYNQTEILAQHALKSLGDHGYEYAPHILARTKHTLQQQGLPQHTRLKNVAQSMEVRVKDAVKDRVCVVLDDVVTTGATFAEARRALMKAGARDVICLALAQSS